MLLLFLHPVGLKAAFPLRWDSQGVQPLRRRTQPACHRKALVRNLIKCVEIVGQKTPPLLGPNGRSSETNEKRPIPVLVHNRQPKHSL